MRSVDTPRITHVAQRCVLPVPGNSALLLAMLAGHASCARLLYDKGASVDVHNLEDVSPTSLGIESLMRGDGSWLVRLGKCHRHVHTSTVCHQPHSASRALRCGAHQDGKKRAQLERERAREDAEFAVKLRAEAGHTYQQDTFAEVSALASDC